MPGVTVTALVPGICADEVFAAVADFAAYPRHTDAVREVVVRPVGEGVESDWQVTFRNVVLAWTERDGDGSTVTFEASFDLGMPSLAPMIDPIAERALAENIRAILGGLLGPAVTFS